MLRVRSQPRRAGAEAGLGAHSPGPPASTSSSLGGHISPWGEPHPSLHPSPPPPAPLHIPIPPTSSQRLGWDLGVRSGCPQPIDAEVEAGAGSSPVREAWEGLQDRVGDAQRAEAGLWLSSQGALGVQEGPGPAGHASIGGPGWEVTLRSGAEPSQRRPYLAGRAWVLGTRAEGDRWGRSVGGTAWSPLGPGSAALGRASYPPVAPCQLGLEGRVRAELQEEAFQLHNSVFRVCVRVSMCAPVSRPGGGGGAGWQGS